MNRSTQKIIIIITTALLLTLFLTSPILSTLAKTPPRTINMLVGHYFEDYYEYLSFIKQGQMGRLFVSNLFTGEDFHTYFAPWWPYSLIGLITYITRLPIPVHLLYWLSSIILLFILFLIIYISISALLPKESFKMRFLAFLLTILSCDFYTISFDKGFHIVPIDYWYSIASPFSRFGTATPHHQIIQISLLLSLLFVIKNYHSQNKLRLYIGFYLFSLLLLFLSPPQSILFVGATVIAVTIYSIHKTRTRPQNIYPLLLRFASRRRSKADLPALPAGRQAAGQVRGEYTETNRSFFSISLLMKDTLTNISPFILLTILLIPFIFIMWQTSKTGPTYISTQLWERQNLYYPPLDLFIKATGPLFILTLMGLYFYIKNIELGKLIYFSVSLLSFAFMLIPLPSASFNILSLLGFHNLRFSTPVTYIFMSLVTVKLLGKIFKTSFYRYTALCLLLLYFLPSLYTRWLSRTQDPYTAGFLQMMPQDLYEATSWLDAQKDNGTLLASPASYIGLITPAIAGKRVYFGRTIFTLDRDTKYQTANQFYSLGFTKNEALDLLKRENIRFITFTAIDGDQNQFLKTYSFLHEIFRNNYVTIYSP